MNGIRFIQDTQNTRSSGKFLALNLRRGYRKIPSPGLIFVQKAFLLGLFSGELIFGGAYY